MAPVHGQGLRDGYTIGLRKSSSYLLQFDCQRTKELMTIRTSIACAFLSIFSAFAHSQVVEYEILPESRFFYTMKDGSGVLTGNIKGLCRVVLRQKHGETDLAIDSMHLTSLTDPEIVVTGGGRWNIGYGSAGDVAKFGLQYVELYVAVEGDIEQPLYTMELNTASVEFPAVSQGLFGAPFAGNFVMMPAGESIKRFFRRGDVDGDEDKDITDAMVVLLHLFQAGVAPTCQDAEDVNDDGSIDLGDAVYLLNRLFLGGERPPVPSQHCGLDRTVDDLDCQGQQACITIDRIE